MSTLGKRKGLGEPPERDEDVVMADETPRGSTLFVSNLPYTATSTDLQTLFSDFAPVRSAFVVTEHGTGVSKGVGYVSFAAREDAQSVWQQAQTDGMKMNGRAIRVAWAEKKPEQTSKEAAESSSQKVKRPKQQATSTTHDPLAIRTVILSGLPTDVTKQVLWKKIRKLPGAEDVELEEGGSAKALFRSPADALGAVSKLHAHIYKGALLSAALKKRLDNLPGSSRIVATDARVPGKTKAPSRASRLIVRNLPWDVEDQDLRALFLPYGPIHSIDIPVSAADEATPDAKPRARGFAFVWMLSKPDAEKALGGLNGSKVRAGLAARLAKEKQKKKKEARLERKAEEGATAGDQESEAKERVIAVDWALSKNRWEEEKGRLEQEAEEDAGDSYAESGNSGSESEGSDHHGVDDETDGSNDIDDSDDEDERSDDEAPAKPQLPQTDVGTTLFVRNVPYEATEDDLRRLFRTFGPLRYARITLDPDTGRGRGTAFACFWNKEDADKAINFSDTLKSDIGLPNSTHKELKKNPFKMPSLLTPDPSSSTVQTLVLHGRTLDLTRAVTRDEASRLREQGERAREKKDKRNLYLLREGVISANSPAAQFLPEVEVQKRMQSFDARRALLKSNPSLYVSKTRLSIRRLPLFVSEKAMRKLATHAMRTFEAEVKAGTRDGLHADELAVDEDDAAAKAEEITEKPRPKKPFIKERRGTIKQAKIVRQMERTDGLTGLARSKGYGFLETRTHTDALRVLRWANNNPAAIAFIESAWKDELEELVKTLEKDSGEESTSRRKRAKETLEALETAKKKAGTLIVEFSIENVQVVQRRRVKQGEAKEAKDKKPMGRLPKLTDQRRPEKSKAAETGDKEERKGRTKKAKLSHDDTEPPKEHAGEAFKSPLGAMIGGKRKQRKMNRVA